MTFPDGCRVQADLQFFSFVNLVQIEIEKKCPLNRTPKFCVIKGLIAYNSLFKKKYENPEYD